MMNEKAGKVWKLFLAFLKIGAFTFGGGYAMIPLVQNEVVQKRKWITDDDILEVVAIAETTPGPIAVNAATFVGFRIGGFFGALAATFGVIIAPFLIILGISFVLKEFQEIQIIQYAFNGIRAGAFALLIRALWSMYKQCPGNRLAYVIMAAAFLLTAFFKMDVLIVIIGCAVFGLASSIVASRRAKQ